MNTEKTSYAVFLPCVEERQSLLETIRIIESESAEHLYFYIITNTQQNADQIRAFLEGHQILKTKYTCRVQVERKLSGAFKHAIELCKEDYFILMATDLETDPHIVKSLIEHSKRNKDDIIVVSRWSSWDNFKDYGFTRMIFNLIFQRLAQIIYRSHLTDITFGYRIYPAGILKKLGLRYLGHAVLLESIVEPLLDGVTVREIQGTWTKRIEGVSKKEWKNNFTYLVILLSGVFRKQKS